MLSEGSWLCCTSTSLLVSPVVVLAGAAAADPKSAISCICRSSVLLVWFVVCAAELSRALLWVGKNFRRVQITRAVATQWRVSNIEGGMRRLREATAAIILSTCAKKDNV
jgi:hypothetical protein